MLNWRSLDCPPDKYLVKGSRLAVALYGPNNRFAIYEVRTLEPDGFSGTRYTVADASLISDAEVKAGKSPPVVFNGETPDECMSYCNKQGAA